MKHQSIFDSANQRSEHATASSFWAGITMPLALTLGLGQQPKSPEGAAGSEQLSKETLSLSEHEASRNAYNGLEKRGYIDSMTNLRKVEIGLGTELTPGDRENFNAWVALQSSPGLGLELTQYRLLPIGLPIANNSHEIIYSYNSKIRGPIQHGVRIARRTDLLQQSVEEQLNQNSTTATNQLQSYAVRSALLFREDKRSGDLRLLDRLDGLSANDGPFEFSLDRLTDTERNELQRDLLSRDATFTLLLLHPVQERASASAVLTIDDQLSQDLFSRLNHEYGDTIIQGDHQDINAEYRRKIKAVIESSGDNAQGLIGTNDLLGIADKLFIWVTGDAAAAQLNRLTADQRMALATRLVAMVQKSAIANDQFAQTDKQAIERITHEVMESSQNKFGVQMVIPLKVLALMPSWEHSTQDGEKRIKELVKSISESTGWKMSYENESLSIDRNTLKVGVAQVTQMRGAVMAKIMATKGIGEPAQGASCVQNIGPFFTTQVLDAEIREHQRTAEIANEVARLKQLDDLLLRLDHGAKNYPGVLFYEKYTPAELEAGLSDPAFMTKLLNRKISPIATADGSQVVTADKIEALDRAFKEASVTSYRTLYDRGELVVYLNWMRPTASQTYSSTVKVQAGIAEPNQAVHLGNPITSPTYSAKPSNIFNGPVIIARHTVNATRDQTVVIKWEPDCTDPNYDRHEPPFPSDNPFITILSGEIMDSCTRNKNSDGTLPSEVVVKKQKVGAPFGPHQPLEGEVCTKYKPVQELVRKPVTL